RHQVSVSEGRDVAMESSRGCEPIVSRSRAMRKLDPSEPGSLVSGGIDAGTRTLCCNYRMVLGCFQSEVSRRPAGQSRGRSGRSMAEMNMECVAWYSSGARWKCSLM